MGVSDIVPSSSGPQGPDEDGNEGNVHWEKGAAEHGERGAAEGNSHWTSESDDDRDGQMSRDDDDSPATTNPGHDRASSR